MSCGNPEAGDENGQEEVALMSSKCWDPLGYAAWIADRGRAQTST